MTAKEEGFPLNYYARKIAAILGSEHNPSFHYYRNDALRDKISLALSRKLKEMEGKLDEPLLAAAWKYLGFLVFAELADKIFSGDTAENLWLADVMRGNFRLLYRFQNDRFHKNALSGKRYDSWTTVESLSCIFDKSRPGNGLIYWQNAPISECAELFEDVEWRIGEFIDSQPDLPGINSLVREGLVKSLRLPSGLQVVTKKNNPHKEGRFLNEQHNIATLVERLGLPKSDSRTLVGFDDFRRNVQLFVIRPFAVLSDRVNDAFYSLAPFTPHPTLEALLFNEISPQKRSNYLAVVRQMLEYLYFHGIIWGDLAPRNILVSEHEDDIAFYLLDFEKTTFTDGSVPHELRLEHARGPMCVEEFGSVCSLDEVLQCFKGYFDPSSWSVGDTSPLSLGKPKREVMDIAAVAGHANPTMGHYNTIERKMLSARFPFVGENGVHRFPLYASFKIDHYWGQEYDRKTTQLFMASAECQCLDRSVDVLSSLLQDVENLKILRQFERRMEIAPSAPSYDFPAERTMKAIDVLYNCGSNAEELQRCLQQFSVQEHFYHVRNEFLLFPESGKEASAKNWEVVSRLLDAAVGRLEARFGSSVLVGIYGSGARYEFTRTSDLDMAVIADDEAATAEAEHCIREAMEAQSGILVEFFPPLKLSCLRAFILSSPESFLDFFYGRIILGSESDIRTYNKIVDVCLKDVNYQKEVRNYYKNLYRSEKSDDTIKQLMTKLHLAVALGNGAGIDDIARLKSRLLSEKCRRSFPPGEFLEQDDDLAPIAVAVNHVFKTVLH